MQELLPHLFSFADAAPMVRALLRVTAILCVTCVCSTAIAQAVSAPASQSLEEQTVATLPPYQPEQSVSGVIRLQGHGQVVLRWMEKLVRMWEKSFQTFQPGVTIEYDMHGTSSAIPSLYTGVGDLAILGEEVDPAAVVAFKKVKHYPPSSIPVITESLDVRNFDYAQQFFVHKDNPIAHFTLAQLDAIFGFEHRRGLANIRTWGQLGLTGEWADKPITPYGWRIDDSFGLYLQQALLLGSHKWNCDLRQFIHINRPDGTIYDHGQQILDNLAKDRYGIAVSNIRYAGPDVKAIPIGLKDGGPFYQATKETVISGTYPLTRIIPAVYDRPPGTPIDPKVKEFLRFLLSREGQQVLVDDGRYLPLNKEAAAAAMRQLD